MDVSHSNPNFKCIDNNLGCICDVSDASDVDPLVYCDVCNLAVHKLCYGIEKIPDDDWYCHTVSTKCKIMMS